MPKFKKSNKKYVFTRMGENMKKNKIKNLKNYTQVTHKL